MTDVFTVEQHIHKPGGTLAATVRSVSGLLDLAERRLVADPARHWLALADKPELLGLSVGDGGEQLVAVPVRVAHVHATAAAEVVDGAVPAVFAA